MTNRHTDGSDGKDERTPSACDRLQPYIGCCDSGGQQISAHSGSRSLSRLEEKQLALGVISTERRMSLSNFVTRCFRDQADYDYITARMLWKTELYRSFLWPALQAIEKYLKAILLYQCHSVKNYGHDAMKVFHAVKALAIPEVSIPAWCEDFIGHLTDYGPNRYFELTFVAEKDYLLKLDWTVWHTRRYCRDFLLMPGDPDRYDHAESHRLLDATLAADPEKPTRFKLEGGLLEKIMDRGPSEARKALLWQNACYGSRSRQKVRHGSAAFIVEIPIHVMRPEEILPLLKELVYLPKDVVAQLEARHSSQK